MLPKIYSTQNCAIFKRKKLIAFFYLAYRNKRLGLLAFSLFSLVMFVIGVNLTFKYKFLPSFDVLLFTGTELYISPWTRIIPYAVGVTCGWFLKKYRKTFTVSDVSNEQWWGEKYPDLEFLLFSSRTQKLRNFMFFLSSFILLLALHATIQRDISVPVASMCILIGRPLIGIAVCWFIITNACGYNCKLS